MSQVFILHDMTECRNFANIISGKGGLFDKGVNSILVNAK